MDQSLRQPSRGKLTNAQEREICAYYLSGESTYRLGARYGTTNTRIGRILKRHEVQARTFKEAGKNRNKKLTAEQEIEICTRYQAGETTVSLGAAFEISTSTVSVILKRNGSEARNPSEAHGGLSVKDSAEVCRRYQAGESTVQLGVEFGVWPSTVSNIVKRHGIELRTFEGFLDTVQHILDGTGRHAAPRECGFYLFELARYADTHCKPGIAFDVDFRSRCPGSRGEYGSEVLRLIFANRSEAFFLEQAVLDITRDHIGCPDDLQDWIGASEVRAMPANDMVLIVLRLADELEQLGPWEFASRYVPMTADQRINCQQRAMQKIDQC